MERDGSSGWQQIATTGANVTAYSNTSGLAAGTRYFYRVRATNAAGDSAYSNVADAVTQPSPATPAAPTNLVSTAATASRIDLGWVDRSSNETGFIFEICTSGTGNWQAISLPANTTRHSVSGLKKNTFYYFRVRAINDAGSSGYSNTLKVKTTSR